MHRGAQRNTEEEDTEDSALCQSTSVKVPMLYHNENWSLIFRTDYTGCYLHVLVNISKAKILDSISVEMNQRSYIFMLELSYNKFFSSMKYINMSTLLNHPRYAYQLNYIGRDTEIAAITSIPLYQYCNNNRSLKHIFQTINLA